MSQTIEPEVLPKERKRDQQLVNFRPEIGWFAVGAVTGIVLGIVIIHKLRSK